MDSAAQQLGELKFFDRQPTVADRREEVLNSLLSQPKYVSAKYFYDQRGSELFQTITELPEYYLTRTELGLFDRNMDEIAATIGVGACLVEFGSGSSQKIRRLLERVKPAAYVPVDISRDHLEQSARALHADYPWLHVYPTCADLSVTFELPPRVDGYQKVGFYPGSSIGNFAPAEAIRFLQNAAETLGAGSRFIIGVDRKKATATLEAAYNDAQGVTAEFNRNLLAHVARVLGVEIDLQNFEHRALYNAEEGCIQMFLDAIEPCSFDVAGTCVRFAAGESIHTENSYKYDLGEFVALARRGGYAEVASWTDSNEWFSVIVFEAR